MSTTELLDDLEAGELSVEFEGEEPEVVLEWAMERFGDRLVLSTAFQEGDVALIDMAYRIDPKVKIFSIDTGRLPTETFELIETLRERYPGLAAHAPLPRRDAAAAARRPARAEPLLPLDRAAAALLQRAQGAAADEAPRRDRRLGHRPASRPVGGPHRHPQGRDRPRPRRDREAEPARRVDGGRGVGLRAGERRARPSALRAGLHLDRLRAVHPARSQQGEPMRAGRWWWESGAPKECGMHCSIETGGFEHELHAILGKDADANA